MATQPLRMPMRRRYQPEVQPIPYHALPFIRGPRSLNERPHYWHLPPASDYDTAYKMGAEFAVHLAQFLRANPDEAGSNLLGQIAKTIDYKDKHRRGYHIGFFTHLERLLANAPPDHKCLYEALDEQLEREQKEAAALEGGDL